MLTVVDYDQNRKFTFLPIFVTYFVILLGFIESSVIGPSKKSTPRINRIETVLSPLQSSKEFPFRRLYPGAGGSRPEMT